VIIVDASVAMKWVIPESGTAAALALRSERISAPDIWIAECANALWRHVRVKEMSESEAIARLARLRSADVTNLAIDGLLSEAFLFANQLDHPIYDCLYLSAAIQNGTKMITADRRFASAVMRRSGLSQYVELLPAR
jgi:predicted nucleic acid-binding protein